MGWGLGLALTHENDVDQGAGADTAVFDLIVVDRHGYGPNRGMGGAVNGSGNMSMGVNVNTNTNMHMSGPVTAPNNAVGVKGRSTSATHWKCKSSCSTTTTAKTAFYVLFGRYTPLLKG